jgi:hypothetical protein
MPLKKVTITIGFICLVYFLLLIIGTLWPFKIQQENDVHWTGDGRGLEFHRHGTTMKTSLRGLSYTKSSFKLKEDFNKETNSITMTLSLSPRIQPLNGLGFIIAFDDEKEPEKLVIAQWRSALIIRKRIEDSDRYSEVGAVHVFENGKNCEVSITFSKRGTNIYLNGNLKENHPGFSYNKIEDILGGRLLLGNSANGKRPWAGRINQVAIYEGEYIFGERVIPANNDIADGFNTLLNPDSVIAYYGFEEQTGQFVYNRIADINHLFFPPFFTMLKKSYLISPFRDIRYNAAFYFDVFINILLFIPLSVFFALVFLRITTLKKSYIYLITVIMCTLMSLAVEIIQVYIPQRSSSILDFGLNILGAIIGIYLLKYILALFPMIKTKHY